MAGGAETIRAGLDALNACDRARAAALTTDNCVLALPDPELPVADAPAGGAIGREALLDWWEAFRAAFDEPRMDPGAIEPLADGRHVAAVEFTARPRGRGTPVAHTHFQVHTLREARIARIESWATREKAVASIADDAAYREAGLEPPPTRPTGMDAAEAMVRTLCDVWNREGIRTVAERFWSADIVWEDSPILPDPGLHVGREAAVRGLESLTDTLGSFWLALERFLPIDGQRAFTVFGAASRAPGSGMPITWRFANLFTFEGGKIVRVRVFITPEETRTELARLR
jgi:ketosteroid isomerase-like protein